MPLLNYKKTFFLKSFSSISQIHETTGHEIAFVGYSNSGKSSVINSLTSQKKLARFSKTPGRTQLINFFEVVPDFRIVDLPGYGYANIPISGKLKLQKMLYLYLNTRNLLKGVVLCMDIRHPLKILDQKIISIALQKKWLVLVLLTKCDKITVTKQKIQCNIVYNQLNNLSHFLHIELFSSLKKIGLDSLKHILNFWYTKRFI